MITRRIATHFPTGFIGNPHVAPKCTLSEFSQGACPADSQIGLSDTEVLGFVPLYNMETRPNQAGLTAFAVPFFNFPLFLELSGRTDSDYGLSVLSTPIPEVGLDIPATTLELWGVPAADEHDEYRFFSPLQGGYCFPGSCEAEGQTGAEATVPPAPFLQNPTICAGPLSTAGEIEWYTGQRASGEGIWPAATGCDQLSFNPSQTTKPTTTHADSATGVDVDLKVPQTQSPTTPAPSELRGNTTILPEGFTINPNAADGKVACTDAQTSIGTLFAATCPDFAKVGTLELDVAALPAPISGALYIGEPKPGDRYRLILTADGFAVHVKLVGSVRPDPQTGRLRVVFEDLPQTPLQRINMHFFGSERGLLATPEHCGTREVGNEFIPWNDKLTTRHATSFITIDAGPGGVPCPNGARSFSPVVQAGNDNTTAGAHSAFTFRVDRADGDQNLSRIDVKTPAGLTASFRGIPYCPEEAIAALGTTGYSGRDVQAAPRCPEASQVGTTVTGAGAGSHPLHVPGKVYLAGPYKGAPLSLVVVTPALSGPYDLGNVAVRVALHVDPLTARATAVSDPLPEILEGVPLRLRSVQVNLDRPGFIINPTNCDPLTVGSQIVGDEGLTADRSIHFQVANCASRRYGPRLTLRLSGGLKRRGHPAIRAVLRTQPGEANSRSVSVTLPRSGLLDNSHIDTICTRVDFAAKSCPSGSMLGTAEVFTPLFDQPLQGPVYLRASSNKLPDMVIDLQGQVDVELVGRIDSVKGRLRTTFASLPDAPIERFELRLVGGKKGLLINSADLCARPWHAVVRMIGQNGRRDGSRSKLRRSCPRRASRTRAVHRRHTRLQRFKAVGNR